MAFLISLVVGACGREAGGGGELDSGVRGVVVAGPQCPVETAESPCPDLPVSDAVVRATREGERLGETRTDNGGRFELGLEPGDYVLEVVLEDAGIMFAKPVTVAVAPHAFAEVTLLVDTGIR